MINLLIIYQLVTLCLGGNHVRVVCEKVWRNAQDCAVKQELTAGSRLASRRRCTLVKHAKKLNRRASCSTIGQKVQTGHSISSLLGLATQSSREAKSPIHFVMKKLTLHIPFSLQYKYPLYPRNIESFQKEFWEINPREKQDGLIHNLYIVTLQILQLLPSPLLHPWEVH